MVNIGSITPDHLLMALTPHDKHNDSTAILGRVFWTICMHVQVVLSLRSVAEYPKLNPKADRVSIHCMVLKQ